MAEEDGELPDRVEVEQARMAVARREVRVIDVRDADDFAAERVFGSVHADPDSVEETIADLDPDGPQSVLLVCSDGDSSAEIADRLREDGIRVSILAGGFDAWTDAHLPTAPGRDAEYEGPDVKIPGAVASEGEPDEDDDEESEPDGSEPGEGEDERAPG